MPYKEPVYPKTELGLSGGGYSLLTISSSRFREEIRMGENEIEGKKGRFGRFSDAASKFGANAVNLAGKQGGKLPKARRRQRKTSQPLQRSRSQ